MAEIGYKIVRRENGGYYSYIIDREKYFGTVEYKVGEWVEPRDGCGPLAVFETLEDAREFLAGPYKHVESCTFKCKYEQSLQQEMRCYSIYFLDPFQRGYLEQCMTLFSAPEGSVLADKVMLLEEEEDD
jgi:hypothetical protein